MAMSYAKGNGPVSASYAKGGPEITTRSRFLKTPNVFTTSIEEQDYEKVGKGGSMAKLEGDSKSKTPPTPKK